MKNKLLCMGLILLFSFSLGCTEKEQDKTTATLAPTTVSSDHSPTAKFSIYPEEPRDAQRIMFQNKSTDPDNDPLKFEWYIDGKYNCSCFSISEKLSKGEHTVKLVAKDPEGNRDEYELKFYVSETFIKEDVSKLVLKREDVGMIWNLVTDEYSGENSYHTVLENGERRIECTVEKYDTVKDVENKFKEYFVRTFPYPTIGNESTYDKDDFIQVTFRYGNLIYKVSTNTTLEDAITYSKSLEAKLNQVG